MFCKPGKTFMAKAVTILSKEPVAIILLNGCGAELPYVFLFCLYP